MLGVGAAVFGSSFATHRQLLDKVAAVAIIALGALCVASTGVSELNREWHLEGADQPRRPERAGGDRRGVRAGVDSVCRTDVRRDPVRRRVVEFGPSRRVLLAVYSVGLGLPILATALTFERMASVFAVVKRHRRGVILTGGIVLIAMGVLIWTRELSQLNIRAQQALNGLGIDFFNTV